MGDHGFMLQMPSCNIEWIITFNYLVLFTKLLTDEHERNISLSYY